MSRLAADDAVRADAGTVLLQPSLFRHFVLSVGGLLALVAALLFAFDLLSGRSQLEESWLTRARAHVRDMVLMRHWVAEHGGVYVEKRAGVESSPYLENPDITASNGKTYTLRNPALITREIDEMAEAQGDYRIRVTSLKLLNERNAPDDWERTGLQAIEGGARERFESIRRDGRSEYRYLAPLVVESACLTCHAKQGFRLGDVRGGVSVRFDTTAAVAERWRYDGIKAGLLALMLLAVFLLVRSFAARLEQRLGALVAQHAAELRQRLAEQETVLHNALVGIVHLRHRRVVSCNRRVEEIFGYDPGELIGQSSELFYANHQAFLEIGERAYACVGEGGNFSTELLLRRRSGELFWGALNGRAIDPAQPQEGSIWIYADLSERQVAEGQVHKLLRAVEQSPVSIVITDRAGLIEYVNPRFTQVTGYSAREAIGQNPRILQSGETPVEIYREIWQALLAGKEWRGALRNRRKNGELFWEEASLSPIVDEQGVVTHFIAVKEDISERKRVEDALRDTQDAYLNILATTYDGFGLINAKGIILDVNARYLEQSGYSRDELLGTRSIDLEADADPVAVAARARSIVEAGSAQYESVHRRKDGSHWDVEVSVSYRHAAGGQFFVFVRDITARKEMRRQLENSREHLEQLVATRTADLSAALEAAVLADKAKDSFLANVSHELRTPLNAVIGLSDLARRNSQDPRQRDYLEKVNQAGQSLLGIINDLLDLSKISAGEMRFESTPFRPLRLISRVQAVLGHRASEKGLRLETTLDETVPEVLLGDSLRVEQVVLNLLGNAIKFTPHGSVSLRIGAVARSQQQVCLKIDVTDSGIGMSEAEMSRIFRPFSQADLSTTRKHGGTGLGLAISRRLAEAMDGSVDVSSRPGQGATFTALLWLGVGRAEDLPVDDLPAEDATPNSCYRDAQVLLVDDQPLNRDIVHELLGLVGIVPVQACDGREALDLVLAAGPGVFDLVLMDIQMPVMDGLEASRAIRALPAFADLPIAAMTAHTMTHEKEVYRQAGMNDHIGKPFTVRDFYALLGRWLAHRAVAVAAAPQAVVATAPQAAGAEALAAIDGLDLHAALERFGGNRSRYERWLHVFIEESGGFVAQTRAQLALPAPEDAGKVAHAFKGRVGMLGMRELHAMASVLEKRIAAGELVEPLLQQLAAAISTMRAALQAALAVPSVGDTGSAPATGADALPAVIVNLLSLLEAADGASASAIENALAALQTTCWAPRLQAALAAARQFEFAAASAALRGEGE